MKMPYFSSSGNNSNSTSTKYSRLGLAVLLILTTSIAWFCLKIRSDYYAKVSVTEAAKFAEKVMTEVDKYYTQYQQFPSSLTAIKLPQGEVGYIPNVTIESTSGVLTVVVESFEGKFGTLRYIPDQVALKHLQWRCESVSVSKEFLPPQCSS